MKKVTYLRRLKRMLEKPELKICCPGTDNLLWRWDQRHGVDRDACRFCAQSILYANFGKKSSCPCSSLGVKEARRRAEILVDREYTETNLG